MSRRQFATLCLLLVLPWTAAAYVGIFKPSGTAHTSGLVPDPGATAGTSRYLREDSTFAIPPGSATPDAQFGTQRLVTSASTILTTDGAIVANATTGSFNLTLPAVPASGTDAFWVCVVGNTVNLFTNGNAQTLYVNGSLTNSTSLGAGVTVLVWYDYVSASKGWRIKT